MYVPRYFREDDPAAAHAIMREFPLATLISSGEDGLVANHVPMLVEPERGPNGTLVCHLARANGQWRDIAAHPVLVIFSGPATYVSPSGYATKRETGKVVPTWNYVAVHAYGNARTFDEPARLHELVTRLTDVHETPRSAPWHVADAPDDYVARELLAIVGIEIVISRLVGKWKMSQNRSEPDRLGTIEDLAASDDVRANATAAVMTGLELRRSD